MIAIKSGVTIIGLRPEMLLGHLIVQDAYASMGKHCTITSITDSAHGNASLHYTGQAMDYRTRHLTDFEKTQLLNIVTGALNEEFDVIMEKDHLHVEFQPKS